MIHLLKWLTTMMLLGIEIVHILLPCIALSDVLHEISIIHGVSHLGLILGISFTGVLRTSKSSNSCLIEHLLFLVHLSIYMGKHLVNP